MTSTYEKIATTTLANSTTNSISFSSISGSYTDLVLIMNVGAATSASNVGLRFNSDTGTNYSRVILSGNGATASSDREGTQNVLRLTYNAYQPTGVFNSNLIVNIQNYSNTTTYKTVINRSNTGNEGVDAQIGLWSSTSAISTVTAFIWDNASYYFLSGSMFTLYGIKAE